MLEYIPKGRAISYRLNGGHIPVSRILVDCIPPPRLDCIQADSPIVWIFQTVHQNFIDEHTGNG